MAILGSIATLRAALLEACTGIKNGAIHFIMLLEVRFVTASDRDSTRVRLRIHGLKRVISYISLISIVLP
jgi:hypothetical protein